MRHGLLVLALLVLLSSCQATGSMLRAVGEAVGFIDDDEPEPQGPVGEAVDAAGDLIWAFIGLLIVLSMFAPLVAKKMAQAIGRMFTALFDRLTGRFTKKKQEACKGAQEPP